MPVIERLGRIFKSAHSSQPVVKATIDTPDQIPTISPLAPEIGVSGLRQQRGVIMEEFHRRLRIKRFYFEDLREMRENDGMINACLLPIEMLLRAVKWDVEPASPAVEDERDAEFVRQAAFDDMSHDWASFISEWAWIFTYGFKPFEIVYKQRRGPDNPDPRFRSKFSDGAYGWRKFAPRDPESIGRWVFDEDGGVAGFVQLDPNTNKEYEPTPITKALLFQTTHNKNNPEGRSLLRGCYVNWYIKKNIQEMEVIEAERDATGYPVLYTSPSVWAAGSETLLNSWIQKVTAIRKDEQQGMVLPAEYDDRGNPLYKFEMVRSAGQGLVNKREIIKGCNLEIAQALMMSWILLGHESVGSKALSVDQTQTCMTALSGWLESLAGVLNRHAIPRLFALNKWNRPEYPKFKPGRIRPADVEGLSNILKNLAAAGFPVGPDANLMNFALREAGMPEVEESEIMQPRAVPGQLNNQQNPQIDGNVGNIDGGNE